MGNYVIAVGNYLIVSPSELGNYMIADMSTYLNALLDAGLEPERFIEPPAPVPTYLLWRCRRR
jgi:hypothetical protein